MTNRVTAVFIASPEIAPITGRYVALLEESEDKSGRYLADDSLVDLSKRLGEDIGEEWYMIEDALNKRGIWHAGV
jgi:hypothetical protein